MRSRWRQTKATLNFVKWRDGEVDRYKPVSFWMGAHEVVPYDEVLLKHLISQEKVECCIVGHPWAVNLNYGVPIITDPYIDNVHPGDRKRAILVCTHASDIIEHVARVEDRGCFDIVAWLVVTLEKLSIEDVIKKGYTSPFRQEDVVHLWRRMMRNTEDRRYSYAEVKAVEDMGGDYIKALACRHLYTKDFEISDERIKAKLREHYIAPTPTHSCDPVTTLFQYSDGTFDKIKWGGIDACLCTLMRIYEIDGVRVMKVVSDGASGRLAVMGACPGALTVDEVAQVVKKKPAEVHEIIVSILKDVEILAMQEADLSEEVWCALPGANIL